MNTSKYFISEMVLGNGSSNDDLLFKINNRTTTSFNAYTDTATYVENNTDFVFSISGN